METVEDPYLRHLFDGDPIFNVYNKETINMSVGAPGPDLLKQCKTMLSNATVHRMEEEEKEGNFYLFQYGITPGLWECREELSKFLNRQYGDPVQRENLILTCGATHGLQLLITSIMSPNGIIFVEEVTYMIALDSFKQFPLMKIITDSCKRLVEIARNNSMLIVAEDVYNLLHYEDGFPPHRLFFYDNPKDPNYKGGNILSNASFSKILSPAIRFGWIEGSPRMVNIFKTSGILCSGGATNHYISGLITSLLQEKIQDEYLKFLVKTYTERLNALCETLDRYLPNCCSYRRPKGGYFVWIHLPLNVDGMDFIKWCQKTHKVSAIPGVRFSYTGKAKSFLRLSIAFHPKETLIKGSTLLCKGLLDFVRNQANKDTLTMK
ncbi:hypothetical protein M0802_004539 [Mischocyttarus mexicanus]|nr:hypothetical protein M0802_004539 [Mischocyttarus mexicanus]